MRPILFCALAALVWGCSGAPTLWTLYHTTDVHGWIDGHPHELQYFDADFGDWASLLIHKRAVETAAQQEFFVIDSGDLIEGTGLSDSTPVHGQYIFPIVQQIGYNYDALTMGNHDDGHPNSVELMQQSFIPFFNPPESTRPRYLTANVVQANNGSYLGKPYSFFTSLTGYDVLILGYIYNFTQNANNTDVTPVISALAEPFFSEAMSLPADIIFVTAHIDPDAPPELRQIYTSIRLAHPTTPLIMFVGHRHLLVFEQWDPNCLVLESGKYFEQIGILTFNLDPLNRIVNLQQSWVNTSRANFIELSGVPANQFDTPLGLSLKQQIQNYWNELQLGLVYGCSPLTYDTSILMGQPQSFYDLYINQLVPTTVFNPATSTTNTLFFISNTATLRDDLYAGVVNKNDLFSINPFDDTYSVYRNMTGAQLSTLLATAQSAPLGALPPVTKDRRPRTPAASTPPPTPQMPFYYGSSIQLVNTTMYDLVVSAYDGVALFKYVNKLFPGEWSGPTPYPTPGNRGSTECFIAFVESKFPCSAACPCPPSKK